MPSTRTRGITVDAHGHRTINKEYRGERIFLRLGAVAQEDAEHLLLAEIDHLELEIERRKHARPLFSDCVKRFLLESKNKRSASAIAWHVRMLLRTVGDLEVRRIHDETLRPLVEARLAEGVSATTVNRTLEVARAVLVVRKYSIGAVLIVGRLNRRKTRQDFDEKPRVAHPPALQARSCKESRI